ncbi:hypothetical protein Anapl_17314 [Anas platyrhynchos]|uniref:Uncharacterized protein n=1 Tax=Anas platyrhynchos TaxID=8839 RepID=R0L2U1_ANAPL|nr:hypothetical protein Anapl_17314 [Anas platyrhynchos]
MSFIVGSRYSNARCRRAARRRVAAAPDKFKAAALLLKLVAKAMQQKARAGEVTAAGSSCQKAPSAARRTWGSRGSVTAQPHSRGRGMGMEGRSPGRSSFKHWDYFSKCDLQQCDRSIPKTSKCPTVEFVLLDPAMGHGKLVRTDGMCRGNSAPPKKPGLNRAAAKCTSADAPRHGAQPKGIPSVCFCPLPWPWLCLYFIAREPAPGSRDAVGSQGSAIKIATDNSITSEGTALFACGMGMDVPSPWLSQCCSHGTEARSEQHVAWRGTAFQWRQSSGASDRRWITKQIQHPPGPPLSVQTLCKAGVVTSNLPVPPSWAPEHGTEQLLPALTLAAGGLQAELQGTRYSICTDVSPTLGNSVDVCCLFTIDLETIRGLFSAQIPESSGTPVKALTLHFTLRQQQGKSQAWSWLKHVLQIDPALPGTDKHGFFPRIHPRLSGTDVLARMLGVRAADPCCPLGFGASRWHIPRAHLAPAVLGAQEMTAHSSLWVRGENKKHGAKRAVTAEGREGSSLVLHLEQPGCSSAPSTPPGRGWLAWGHSRCAGKELLAPHATSRSLLPKSLSRRPEGNLAAGERGRHGKKLQGHFQRADLLNDSARPAALSLSNQRDPRATTPAALELSPHQRLALHPGVRGYLEGGDVIAQVAGAALPPTVVALEVQGLLCAWGCQDTLHQRALGGGVLHTQALRRRGQKPQVSPCSLLRRCPGLGEESRKQRFGGDAVVHPAGQGAGGVFPTRSTGGCSPGAVGLEQGCTLQCLYLPPAAGKSWSANWNGSPGPAGLVPARSGAGDVGDHWGAS